MADFNGNQDGVFGSMQFNGNNNEGNTSYFEGSLGNETTEGTSGNGVYGTFQEISKDKAMTKQGLWSKIRAFLFQEIDLNAPVKIELTPYQQKVEDEINEFLHQDITFKSITNIFKGKK